MSKRYTKEFKQTIMDLYNQGKNASQLASEYEVGYSTVLKWVQETKKTSPDGLTPDEVKALKKQLKIQAEEIVILKKALGLLAKN